ncbi:glycosyltransferase involved in cell wall biosynthesis [Xanthomonas arboricola]|uniref:glycosyltransferase n=1 Tax=Xanthomonas euroxanthea TaxID=2259622 RepID=UPI00161722A1|nr:glycosyltransferase [Xanthomonas euroxanthea]MBB3813589.1 glycosyltransferase involved in cell wall biosynthesis [Xanthomonas euroxanthea]
MRIAIDLQGVQTESRHRGIGRYSLSLAEAMLREPRDHEFWLVVNGDIEQTDVDALAYLLPPERVVKFRSVQPVHWRDPANAWRRAASERMREAFLQTLQPDVIHVSSLVEGAQDSAVTSIGRRPSSPFTATTLYDLIPLHDQRYIAVDWAAQWYADKVKSLRRADLLLAISDHVRSDAIDSLSVDPDRVVNISSAASEAFRPIPISDDVRAGFARAYGIYGHYLMYSGAMDPRKNLETLIAAYALLGEDIQQRYQLVVTGQLTDLERERLALVARRLRLPANRIICTGWVSDHALVKLYCGAELFVLPSLQEGFGLPLLEAMACGTPSIGARASSIPEVIGREDALFDPSDASAIAFAIRRVLDDVDFAASLRQYGPQRASKFSWAKSASRALDAFEDCCGSRPIVRLGWREAHEALETTRGALVAELADARSSQDVVSEEDLMQAAAAIDANEDLARDVLRRYSPLADRPIWRVEGPFDSSYSLALVNRELARALASLNLDVALHSTDGAGDFAANTEFLAANPAIAELHDQTDKYPPAAADVCSRLLYPPRVADMMSRFNLLHAYAWEESEIPAEWVADFNEFLQGISALSTHVVKTLVDSGAALPLAVCGAGVDHWDGIPDGEDFQLQARSFRFLHVSSCLPRKGVDVLLKAYGDSFSNADDVTLVIKTFTNPQNDVRRWLNDAQRENADFPHVIIIEEDIDSATLKQLYSKCDVMVAPSRAEGFGLPLAEAMVSGLAVITTAWGGQCEFCNEDTSWLIDYTFAPAETVFGLPHSVWAEPSRRGLSGLLREVYGLSPEERMERTLCGQRLLRNQFLWKHVAQRLVDFAHDISARPIRAVEPVIGWIERSAHYLGAAQEKDSLADALSGKVVLLRSMSSSVSIDVAGGVSPVSVAEQSITAFDRNRVNAVVIEEDLLDGQEGLADLLDSQQRHDRVVIVLLSNVSESMQCVPALLATLRRCHRILVPDIVALNVLRQCGIVANAAILPPPGEVGALNEPIERLRNMIRSLLWQHASSSQVPSMQTRLETILQ